MKLFDGKATDSIVKQPAGESGFGFYTFFIHEGDTITRAQMSQVQNEQTYAQIMKPFAKVRHFTDSL
ncbi:MAG: non-canonical purine NTP pyrophosphatase [Acidimicrobiia bacterium]|jgi:inosine/xanthosine triphosphate pyrophosphatase family protein